MFAFVA